MCIASNAPAEYVAGKQTGHENLSNWRRSCLKMLKRSIYLWVVLFVVVGSVMAQSEEGKHLGVNLEAAFVSQYMWYGYDILDGDPAFQPSVTFDLFQTGFSLTVWSSFALKSGSEDLDEIDYAVAYEKSFFEDEIYAMDVSVDYIYYDYPNISSDTDVQEVGGSISFPNLIPIGPSSLVPSYAIAYDWPVHSEGPNEGCFHIFGLGYDLPIPTLIPEQEEQFLSLTSDLTYNDGAYDADPGWSHSTVGISTAFEWKGFTLTPSVNYQWSFEDTVNDEDEFWAGISLGYGF